MGSLVLTSKGKAPEIEVTLPINDTTNSSTRKGLPTVESASTEISDTIIMGEDKNSKDLKTFLERSLKITPKRVQKQT